LLKQKKIDILIISLLFISAIALYFGFNLYYKNNSSAVAEISIKGEISEIIPLNEEKLFSINSIQNIKFEIKENKIRFIESDCPDKVCIHTGFIGTIGQTAVCLPNNVSIKIIPINGDNTNYDVII